MNDAKYFYFFCLPTCNIMNYVDNIPYICFFVYYSFMLTFDNRCKTSLKPAQVELELFLNLEKDLPAKAHLEKNNWFQGDICMCFL